MKVVVTGGSGFIGAATGRKLEEAGHEWFAFDRYTDADILNLDDLKLFKGMDHVIHLAGMLGTEELFDAAHEAIEVNMIGTLNVLQACEEYALGYTGISMPDSDWKNVYQATKLGAMRLASAWHDNKGVPVSHVRAFNAYGPGQKHGEGHPRKIIPTFATEAYAKRPIPIWGNGLQSVDLVHVDDVAEMLVRAMRFGDDQTFDAGTGEESTVRRVAWMVNMITGNDRGYELHPMRLGEKPDTAIVAKGEGWDLLGWKPEFDPERFREAVESYAPWKAN